MVFAIPALAVVGGIVLFALAASSWDGLVADDYYRRGMQINRALERDAAAARLGLRAVLRFPGLNTVELRLSDPSAAGGRLVLHLAHATRAGADVQVEMRQDADPVWRGELSPLSPGKWYAEIGNERWRLSAALWIPLEKEELTLRAPAAAGE